MTWLVWRQYRAQAAIASALLAALAAVVLADGFAIASRWHSVLVSCAGNGGCLQQQPPLVNGLLSDLPYIALVVPIVLGMLWGAPLVASELEARTSDFAWTQSVTRTRWLAVKAGWLLLAPAVTTYFKVTSTFTPSGQAWVLAAGGVSRTGQVVGVGWGDLVPVLPAACQSLLPGGPEAKNGASMTSLLSCLQAHGWRGFVTYQPGSRYWPFQGIETGIYVLLAAALIAVAFAVVRRRDA